MPNYQEQIAEFEKNYSVVIDKEILELSKTFDTLFYKKVSSLISPTIKT